MLPHRPCRIPTGTANHAARLVNSPINRTLLRLLRMPHETRQVLSKQEIIIHNRGRCQRCAEILPPLPQQSYCDIHNSQEEEEEDVSCQCSSSCLKTSTDEKPSVEEQHFTLCETILVNPTSHCGQIMLETEYGEVVLEWCINEVCCLINQLLLYNSILFSICYNFFMLANESCSSCSDSMYSANE